MIHIEPVNEKTFKRVLDMKLPPEQDKFVAPNIVSLAQAWLYYDEARPFAVLDGDEVVGFIMLDWDEDERTAGIWRFMIAHEHQGKGYGRKAMEAAMQLVKDTGRFDMMHLDFVPGNDAARALYYSLGFRENGDIEDGEIVMTLPLTSSPKVGMLTADEDDMEDFEELIECERTSGNTIPDEIANKEKLEMALEEKRVKRFTIMGETVGIAIGDALLYESGSEYADEIKARHSEWKKQ